MIPFVSLSFNGRVATVRRRRPQTVLIRQREFTHDVAVLRYERYPLFAARVELKKGTPVTLRWGWQGSIHAERFDGYVHSFRHLPSNGDEPAAVEVFLVGAAYRMNRTRTRTLRNVSPLGLIRTLAREHRLAFQVEATMPQVRSDVAQLGRSDWRMLADIVREHGMTLSARRTTLLVQPHQLRAPRAPTFFWDEQRTRLRTGWHDLELKVGTQKATSPTATIGGVDDDGKVFMVSTADCSEFIDFLQNTAHNQGDARRALAGLGKFPVQAIASLGGAPRLRCGQTLKLMRGPLETSGMWFASQVEHRLTGLVDGASTYTTSVELGRHTLETPLLPDEPERLVVVERCVPLDDPPVTTMPMSGTRPLKECPPIDPVMDTMPCGPDYDFFWAVS